MPTTKPSRRHFTPAAQAAAIAARRRKRETAAARDALEVFVVRRPTGNLVFGWEIRRFGAVVLDRSPTDYPSTRCARTAGDAVLSSRLCGA